MMGKDYKQINQTLWNNKVDVHIDSEFYNNESFLKGRNTLNNIELELLGDINGKSVLHLQCHFGQDTISLARMGAKVTGMDISDKAIEKAKGFANECKVDAEFICCDVYDLPIYLDKKFDIVFTSYGVIGWLPDVDKWASIIKHFLKPNGKLVFVEFHPAVWMYDDDCNAIKYSYFKADPILEVEEGTYANQDADIADQSVSWNHSLGEVMTSLLNQGFQIMGFDEYNYSPYNCFNNMIEFEKGKFQIKKFADKFPMVYSIVAEKLS